MSMRPPEEMDTPEAVDDWYDDVERGRDEIADERADALAGELEEEQRRGGRR